MIKMKNYMFELLCQMTIEEAVEMSRELRELSEMSGSERDIYALLNPEADLITACDKDMIISSREDILMTLN